MESSATPDANARRVAALRTPSGLGSLLSVMAGGEPESLRMLCGDADFGTAMLERYAVVPGFFNPRVLLPLRSEEHTSELQSLMRISYAVFCLQKKHTTHYYNN